jgi:hypothetical protein
VNIPIVASAYAPRAPRAPEPGAAKGPKLLH